MYYNHDVCSMSPCRKSVNNMCSNKWRCILYLFIYGVFVTQYKTRHLMTGFTVFAHIYLANHAPNQKPTLPIPESAVPNNDIKLVIKYV